jgi:transcriptional regulator with XRE-family HTH domain
MDHIGEKIKKIRELRNFSRKFVANELLISVTTYGKIERNNTDITVKRLYQIANVLNVGASTILDFDENLLFSPAFKERWSR